ncbi:hypothetical protein [uncultured Croceitalea sp.]|uniref:hypothetical protein n=1 Tax=uncultured Croceitalea sp. TaxID=1798908 RepID=UPI003305641F
MKKSKVDIRHLSTLAVLLISICALVVSIRQTFLLSEQQELITKAEKAQLWPRISIKSESTTTKGKYKRFEFSIINVGVGPAIIESFEIKYKEELITSFLDAYKTSISQKTFNESLKEIQIDNGLLLLK